MSQRRPNRLTPLFAATGLALALAANPATALELTFPGPSISLASIAAAPGRYALPTGPWYDGEVPHIVVVGMIGRHSWRIEKAGLTTFEIMEPLRAQLESAGYTILYECETADCGGFDFRFDAGVLPEPDMHVDLGDFRFLSAQIEGANPDSISLMVSKSASAGFVQATRAKPMKPSEMLATATGTASDAVSGAATSGSEPPAQANPAEGDENAQAPAGGMTVSLSTAANSASKSGDIGADLLAHGAVVLDGLEFETGTTALTEGRYDSLAALAKWLKANPDKSVTLVGHTDTSGGLSNNIAISKQRADSVRKRLISAYDLPPAQLDAEGVGYLAPLDSNLTEQGRTNNRRVEAVLTSTQ